MGILPATPDTNNLNGFSNSGKLEWVLEFFFPETFWLFIVFITLSNIRFCRSLSAFRLVVNLAWLILGSVKSNAPSELSLVPTLWLLGFFL